MTQKEEESIPHSASTFKQQKLYSCRFFLNPCTSSIIYFVMSGVCLILGICYIVANQNTWEKEIRYDDICDNQDTCTINLDVEEDHKSELFVYYKLTKFYHSNFMYTSSKNWGQLEGEYESEKDLSQCQPLLKVDNTILAPCGALPHSIFNDTFDFDSAFPVIEKPGISEPQTKKFFKEPNSQYDGLGNWLKNNPIFPEGQQDERFVNWVQTAAFPTFRKLWGRTNKQVELKKGRYTITIHNNYPVKSFKGQKSLIFAEVAWIGGQNKFTGIFFMVLFGLSLILGVVPLILYFTNTFTLYQRIKNLDVEHL